MGQGEGGTGAGAARPECGPPLTEATTKTLGELLEIQKGRLQVALRIEAERRIVFPETSVIVRDIERLLFMLEGDERAPQKGKAGKARLSWD